MVIKDKFETGIFWELYKDLERQFEDYVEYVPYLKDSPGGNNPKGNERVYSFKLLSLILSIGGYVDSVFKEMARYKDFIDPACKEECRKILTESKKHKQIGVRTFINTFEKEYALSQHSVIFKCLPSREELYPFAHQKNGHNIPEWWTFYNGLKHDLSLNLKKANLRNARDALAGAFILNVTHIPSVFRLNDSGVLKCKYDYSIKTADLKRQIWGSKPAATIETTFFIYDYENNPSYKFKINDNFKKYLK
ncbi:MAG: hypothetical protein NWF01_07925 [Candidatus Bathyarchaeota archaeon]|nr:hypothetical protein [Candidatus Bathyarchaeota archaeon]